jgi:hypothetical protein
MNKIVSTCTLFRYKNFALLYIRGGAGADGAASKFLPGVATLPKSIEKPHWC